uniref:Transposase n=1 Tax=Ditylenchus dipsaci TaxID=166011 RepID=A0A915CTK4_9BILA
MIITMMEEWDVLREQVHVVVRDEEANIKKAMENTGYDHLNCAAHMLNLVVKNSITELMELLQKCRSLVAHFRHSNLACERLREEQEREETPLHHLIFRFKDVPTCWNSTYDMCQRLIEQKKAIEVYLARYKHRKLDLEETEWDMVGLLVNLLVMAKEASDQLCRDESSTSMIIPVYCKLKAFMNSTDQLNFRTLKTKFMKLLEDKFYLENSRIHVLATFLDPRFKDYYSANTLQFNQKASKWLLEEVGEQEGELDAEQDLSSPAPKMIRKEKSFFDDDDDEVPRVQIFKMSGTEAEMLIALHLYEARFKNYSMAARQTRSQVFNVSCRAERITDLTFFGGTRNILIGFAEEGDHQLNIESIDLRNKQLFELGIQREPADSETIILIPDPSPGGVVAIDLESAFY